MRSMKPQYFLRFEKYLYMLNSRDLFPAVAFANIFSFASCRIGSICEGKYDVVTVKTIPGIIRQSKAQFICQRGLPGCHKNHCVCMCVCVCGWVLEHCVQTEVYIWVIY